MIPAVNMPLGHTASVGTTDIAVGLSDRIRIAAARVEEMTEALGLARQQRDELIVEAADQGVPRSEIARWSGLGRPRIVAILAEH